MNRSRHHNLESLWSAAAAGDPVASNQLVEAVGHRFSAFIRRRVGGRQDELEIERLTIKCQNTLAAHFAKLSGSSYPDFLRWLESIARVQLRRATNRPRGLTSSSSA